MAFGSHQSQNLFAHFSIILTLMVISQRHFPKSMCSVKHRGKNTDRIKEVTFTAIAEQVPATVPCLVSSVIHTGFTRIRTSNVLLEFTLQIPHQCSHWTSLIMQVNFVRERWRGGGWEAVRERTCKGQKLELSVLPLSSLSFGTLPYKWIIPETVSKVLFLPRIHISLINSVLMKQKIQTKFTMHSKICKSAPFCYAMPLVFSTGYLLHVQLRNMYYVFWHGKVRTTKYTEDCN